MRFSRLPGHFRLRRKAQALPCLAAALLLGACVFGGGSDQPNKSGEMSGAVRGTDGEPVASARVSLYRGKYLSGYDAAIAPSTAVPVAHTVSDVRGSFRFPDPGSGPYFVEAISADSGTIGVSAGVDHQGGDLALASLGLAEAATLTGSVVSASPILSLHLAGTHFRARIEEEGRFRFGALPPGDFWLIARLGGAGGDVYEPVRALHLEAGTPKNVPDLRVEKDRIPLFDFESADPHSALRGLSYAFAQPAGSREGAWKPLNIPTDTAGAYRGRSYHAILKLNEFFGFALGNGYYDLSKMKSLSFYAKGRGTLEVQFHTGLIDNPDPTMRATLVLDSAWKKMEILPANILVPAGSTSELKGYTWDKAKDQVAKITFSARVSDMEIWVDEVALEGIGFRDLGPARPAGTDAFP